MNKGTSVTGSIVGSARPVGAFILLTPMPAEALVPPDPMTLVRSQIIQAELREDAPLDAHLYLNDLTLQ
jgi:hypothetical protein